MRDLKRELADWQGWPPAWIPEPDEILVGVVEAYATGPTQYGDVRTVLVRDENTGERVSLWLSSTVLLSLFDMRKPLVGERIGLKYLGKHETKGYHRYHLVVERDAEFTPLGGEECDDEPSSGDEISFRGGRTN